MFAHWQQVAGFDLALGAILSMFWVARDAGETFRPGKDLTRDRHRPAIIRYMRGAPEALAPGARISRTHSASANLASDFPVRATTA